MSLSIAASGTASRTLTLAGTNTGENKFTGLLGDGIGALASEISSLAKFEAGSAVGPLVILICMDIPVVIMLEAGLSYLNLGIKPPSPSWGNILSEGYTSLRQAPHVVIVAGIPLVLATLVRLLDTTYLRVGNEEYAATNRSYGLTTLRTRHVQLKGSQLKLRFRGKSGVLQEVELDDPRVARVVRRCQQLPGQELFQYEDEDGSLRTVGSGDVNDYLREITHGAADSEGDHFTAKDFRTWHGTTQALELTRLACTQPVAPTAADKNVRYNAKAILAEVARQLGNTPAVCKKSYVHPAVLELGTRLASDAGPGLQAVWNHIGGTTSPRGLSAAERRLLAFLRKPQKLHKARPTTKA